MRSGLVVALLAASTSASAAIGPSFERCPADFELVRRGQSISSTEKHYAQKRLEKVAHTGAFKTYLKNVQGTGVHLPQYLTEILESEHRHELPTVGISTSGGGYRASIFGAGVLNALDGRNASAAKKGTGGLLQAATHISGLSGGSWLVTSLAQANFPTIQHLIFGDGKKQDYAGWLFQEGLVTANNASDQPALIRQILDEIAVKARSFPVSFGDIWGRGLARHFTNGTLADNYFGPGSHGSNILFSDLMNLPTFKAHEQPLPIITVNLVSKHINGTIFPGGNFVPLNTPMFEYNLFEFGSYDDVLAAHTPLKHIGSTNETLCAVGFDQAMFLSGTSSNLWNEFNVTAATLAAATGNLTTILNATFPQPHTLRLDTSNYPNPFHGVAPETFADSHETVLALCDGGEDGQVSPLQPMLVKDRKVDVIVEIDAVSDNIGYAQGASLIATQERMQMFSRGLARFPAVPNTTDTFLAEGLTSRPTFFGCDETAGPLLVYIANGAPPRDGSAPLTNTTTGQGIYTEPEIQGMLQQTFTVATQGASLGNSHKDPEWAACLACAVGDRARERKRIERSGICKTCFARYCWSA